jgi:hypothetical protein
VIILPGYDDVVSFNDDTSVDGRVCPGPKNAINAQVIREGGLDWFFRLLLLCPDISGEVKTSEVWPQFCSLRSDERELIWAGLSKVHIHIVDPRPYVERTNDVLRESWRRRDAPELLARMRGEGKYVANWFSAELAKFTADSILWDSTAARVHHLGRALGPTYPFFDSEGLSGDERTPINVDDFPNNPRSIVRSVTAWSAKSAAAFEPALHCIEDLEEEIELYRFLPEQLIKRRMESRILSRHAFDEGNQRHIELLEDARLSILKTLSSSESWCPLNPQQGYPQFKSRESFFGQAADIAAGIATHVMEAQALVATVSQFEYVTYNGIRVSRKDAEEQMRHDSSLR